jgi:hypothetical protein
MNKWSWPKSHLGHETNPEWCQEVQKLIDAVYNSDIWVRLEKAEKRIKALEDHTHAIIDSEEVYGLTEPRPNTPTNPPEDSDE